MKKHNLVILVMTLMLLFSMMLTFGACANVEEPNDEQPNTEPSGSEFPEDDIPLSGLILIKANEAKFNFVITSTAGSGARKSVTNLIKRLRDNMGMTINDLVEEKDAAQVSEYEIIVGTSAKNRPGCEVIATDLGNDGYVIKVVGNKVVIAGGTPQLTAAAFNKFVKDYMGITDDTDSKRNLAIDPALNEVQNTKYSVESFTIAGNDISEYVITYNQAFANNMPVLATNFKDTIYDLTGKVLNVGAESDVSPEAKRIYMKLVDDAGEDGFRIFVENNNFVVECALKLMYKDTFEEFVAEEMMLKSKIAFPADYTYSKHIATVKYSDFDVKGDGKTNDYFNIIKAHEAANLTKQTVVAKGVNGNKFYIGKTWLDNGEEVTIPIRSNCDFTGATFYIDDNVSGAYDHRTQYLFTMVGDENGRTYQETSLITWADKRPIAAGATSISWLAGRINCDKFYVRYKDSSHKDFIRYGSNADSGSDRTDVLIVNRDGTIDPSTPVAYPVDNVTELLVIPLGEEPITVKGGNFVTRCKKAPSNGSKAPTAYIYRGILLSRNNATLTNITHTLENEPTSRGYSSYGIVNIRNTADVTFKDSKIVGRKSYGSGVSSYGLVQEYSINVTCENIQQTNINTSGLWGINASNGCKNLIYENCTLSRIDAHRAVWGIKINKCTIKSNINLIGGGECLITNTKRTSGTGFIDLRNDYGASFNGTITIKNCSFTPSASTPFVIKSGFSTGTSYLNHNFGYTRHMPKSVTLINFTCNKTYYVFNDIANTAFSNSKYIKTKNVYYNMSTKPKICPNPNTCTQLKSIPISKVSG